MEHYGLKIYTYIYFIILEIIKIDQNIIIYKFNTYIFRIAMHYDKRTKL